MADDKAPARTIDLNCDLGEGFGAYSLGHDDALMEFITSANIACGFHAGDPATMRRTVRLALEKEVGIGAHPGFPDLSGFGRREMILSPQEVYDLTVYQIGALDAFARSEGGRMRHVKPHGALYNMAARSAPLSEALAEAVYRVNPEWILFGLSDSETIRAGERIGLRTASEVFADRAYAADASLVPRSHPEAVHTDPDHVVEQAVRLAAGREVVTLEGEVIRLKADTICLHGDGAHAVEFARRLREGLAQAGIEIRMIGDSDTAPKSERET